MPAELKTALVDSAELAKVIGISQNTIKRWPWTPANCLLPI